MMTQRGKELKPNTRQKILDTAIELIWQSSYGSVSVDEICKQAGVQKGSFYHFFPSKIDLAAAAVEDHWNQISSNFDHIFSPQLNPVERIENYCETVYLKQKEKLKIFGKVCGCPFATLGAEVSTQNEILRLKTQEVFSKSTMYFETTLRDAAELGLISKNNIKEKAAEVGSYALGVMLNARIHNDVEIIKRDLRTGIFRIIDIIKKTAQEAQPESVQL